MSVARTQLHSQEGGEGTGAAVSAAARSFQLPAKPHEGLPWT
jgi:hypothetical protein